MQNVLFIVEGKTAEPNLIYHLQRLFDKNTEYNVFSYETSIYELYDELSADDDLDIVLLAKELASTEEDEKMLSQKFSKIYLLFDFDPHYQKFDLKKIKDMLIHFHDSTDGGKLYINYPMIESFRHISQMPDVKFFKRTVSEQDLYEYKDTVARITLYSNYSKLSFVSARDILIHHFSKMGYLVHDHKIIYEEDCFDMDSKTSLQILDIAYESYLQNKLPVLNTSILYLVDLKQSKFIKSLVKHQIAF